MKVWNMSHRAAWLAVLVAARSLLMKTLFSSSA